MSIRGGGVERVEHPAGERNEPRHRARRLAGQPHLAVDVDAANVEHSPGRCRAVRARATPRAAGLSRSRRRALLPLPVGQPCALCGEVMTSSDQLDLDHATPLAHTAQASAIASSTHAATAGPAAFLEAAIMTLPPENDERLGGRRSTAEHRLERLRFTSRSPSLPEPGVVSGDRTLAQAIVCREPWA